MNQHMIDTQGLDQAGLDLLEAPALRYFLDYVRYATQADEQSETCPSSSGQWDLARRLLADLQDLGLEAQIDENGYVMGRLAASPGCEKAPTVGFIAHMDTALDLSDAGLRPRVQLYQGQRLSLDPEGLYGLDEETFPQLKELRGKHLVTTSGDTLLGADDKAGIAAIMGLLEQLQRRPELRHGAVAVCFTPDEEIGRGAWLFDVERFAADLAYTIDGGPLGELENETFNAASAQIHIQGRSVHPGTAKGQMVNAAMLAAAFISAMPEGESPADTEGREGFFHLSSLQGGVEEAQLHYIIRDFDKALFQRRKNQIESLVQHFNETLDSPRFSCQIEDQYYNMYEVIERYPALMDLARQAMEDCGIQPIVRPIRGGTDGCQLSFKGLPCPNLYTGGNNFHGRYEYLCIEDFLSLQDFLPRLLELYADQSRDELMAGN